MAAWTVNDKHYQHEMGYAPVCAKTIDEFSIFQLVTQRRMPSKQYKDVVAFERQMYKQISILSTCNLNATQCHSLWNDSI